MFFSCIINEKTNGIARRILLLKCSTYKKYRHSNLIQTQQSNLMCIGPCIIAIVDEWKTNLSLVILFHLLCAQHVSDINISIFRSLRLCWWITTSVALFSFRCMLELLLRLIFGGVRFAGWSTTSASTCGNSSTQSQAPEDGYINVRNMLSA